MMIKGAGIDLVKVSRIEKVYRRHPNRFLRRLFTPAEREEILKRKNIIPALAARFAGKEAVAKALGSGIGRIAWRDIELLRREGTPPVVNLCRTAKTWAESCGVTGVKVSWAHESGYAVAQAVAY